MVKTWKPAPDLFLEVLPPWLLQGVTCLAWEVKIWNKEANLQSHKQKGIGSHILSIKALHSLSIHFISMFKCPLPHLPERDDSVFIPAWCISIRSINIKLHSHHWPHLQDGISWWSYGPCFSCFSSRCIAESVESQKDVHLFINHHLWFIIFLKTPALPQEQLEPASSCKIVHCYASGNVGMTPSQVTGSGGVWFSMLGKIMVRYAAESGYCFNVKIGRNTWRTPYIIFKLIYYVILIYKGN